MNRVAENVSNCRMPLGLLSSLRGEQLAGIAPLLFSAAAADVAESLGEGGDVVDHPEAMHHRVEHAGAAEIHRPRRARVGHGRAAVGGDDLSVRQRGHPVDAAAQLIEHGELADAPGDELELLALLARHGVAGRRVLEEKRLEARVEQQRQRDAAVAIGIDAEQRQRGAEGPFLLEQFRSDRTQALEGVAEALEVAPQIAGDEVAQLAQVGADELLGENEDVVLQQPEELLPRCSSPSSSGAVRATSCDICSRVSLTQRPKMRYLSVSPRARPVWASMALMRRGMLAKWRARSIE